MLRCIYCVEPLNKSPGCLPIGTWNHHETWSYYAEVVPGFVGFTEFWVNSTCDKKVPLWYKEAFMILRG